MSLQRAVSQQQDPQDMDMSTCSVSGYNRSVLNSWPDKHSYTSVESFNQSLNE